MRHVLVGTLFGLLALGIPVAHATTSEIPDTPVPLWSFSGPLGTYDKAQLQRGFQVYKEVCSSCHSITHLHYRDLEGLGFSKEEVQAIARQYQVQDGPDDQGNMFERPAKPEDPFHQPFANEKAARAANGGAYPVDQSLITKARPGGTAHVYRILTGYGQAPAGVEVPQGKYYNVAFEGHAIAMAPPLVKDQVTFADGTPATIENMSADVAAFLTWAADPHMEARKETGIMVLLYLVGFTSVMFFAMRRIWRRVK